MSSTKETKTETKQSRDPWAPAQPFIKDVMSKAKKTFNSGAGSQYFPDSTVVPYSDSSNQAIGMLKKRALNGSPVMNFANRQMLDTLGGKMFGKNPASSTYKNFTNSGDYKNDTVSNIANNYNDPSKAFYQNMQDGGVRNNADYSAFTGAQSTPAQQYLTATAAGDMVGQNPYLDKTFDTISNKVSDKANSLFSRAGRYGSEAHQGTLTDSLGGIANNLYGNAYNQERRNQLMAANSLQSSYDTDMARRMGATDRQSNVTEANLGREVAGAKYGSTAAQNEAATKMAASGLFGQLDSANKNFQMQGANALSRDYNQERQNQMRSMFFAPQAANQDYYDIAQLAKAGGLEELKSGQHLQDKMNRFNFAQNNPWDRLSKYSQLALGYGNAGGQSQGTSNTVQKTGGLGPIVGGIMGGLNMATQMMGMPGGGGMPGMSAMGGGGPAGGMFPKLTYNGPSGGGFYG